MWIATLAIAGIPPFSGFFSKDEILGAAFARAHGSPMAETHWLGIPGSAVLYFVYFLGLASAFLTAIYMTRMMLYTFHGPNRTGAEEGKHLHEAPWIMTGPLLVLGVLSALGGWLNFPPVFALGRPERLAAWIGPITGESSRRLSGGGEGIGESTEQLLIGLAVLIAIGGIAFAYVRLKPASLVPKNQSPEEEGFEKVLVEKYYVDEAYDRAIIQPTYAVSKSFLWRFIDVGVIDSFFVNGIAKLTRGLGWVGSRLQTGSVGIYAWVLVVGVLAVLGAFTRR
jgi:NADH-quinone oxidoreductase subunit L